MFYTALNYSYGMDQDETHYEDIQFSSDDSTGVTFSRHSAPLKPFNEEDAIRTEAANVVRSMPLPDDPHAHDSRKISSSVYGEGGVQQSDIESLKAEDIREEDFLS